VASLPLRLNCHRRRSGRRRSCRCTTAEHTLCAEEVPSGHQQGLLPPLAVLLVRVRVWAWPGLPRLALVLVRVRVWPGLPRLLWGLPRLALVLVRVRVWPWLSPLVLVRVRVRPWVGLLPPPAWPLVWVRPWVGLLPPPAWPLVWVRPWVGLPPSWSVQVRVSRLLLLSLRVGLLLPLFLAVRSLVRSLACRRRRSSRRRWFRYTRVGYTPSAEVLPAGPQQGRLLLSLRLVRVRAGRGLPPLALLLVQVQVSPPLLSLRVGLLLPVLVGGSGESVLLPLFLAVRSLVRSLACRRRRSSHRRWCRYTLAGCTPSAEGLPSGPQQGRLRPLSLVTQVLG
jgi:hypothetical protein